MIDTPTPPASPALPATQDGHALVPADDASRALDAHGFDPEEFDWRPVPRRRRADGWSPEIQRRFIESLADTGMVKSACQAVDMSEQSAYRLRRSPGAQAFARAWNAALAAASYRLIDVAYARAIEGEDIPVFDRDGCRIGGKRRYNDRLLMFLLRSYQPDQFGPASVGAGAVAESAGGRQAPAPAPRAALLLADALAQLEPVTPAEPHRLMPPEQIADDMETARQVAAVYERHAPDDRERYAHAPAHQDHPAAIDRRQQRHAREIARWDAEQGPVWD